MKRTVGLGKRRGAGLLGVPQMPDHTAMDNCRQIDLIGETAAVLLIGEEIGRQRETTAGQHGHQAVMAQCAHQTIEGHR